MLVAIVICIVVIAFIYWLRVLENRRHVEGSSIFYRKYRVQDYSGQGKDLILTHDQLVVHPDLSQYEDQFLFILFGDEEDIVLKEPDRFDRITLRVRVESQSSESEQAIADRLKRIGK